MSVGSGEVSGTADSAPQRNRPCRVRETVMPPTLKETVDSQNTTSGSPLVPVCLEVPVTVRGAVTDSLTNQSQSFMESTRTVLVFARGAVLRLEAAVTPGQTVILVNEHTKKEVRCEVLKSKAYRSGSGVIELEFGERSGNFWGISFPDERPARKAAQNDAPAPAAAPRNDLPLGVASPVTNSYSGEAELAPLAETPETPAAPALEPLSAAPAAGAPDAVVAPVPAPATVAAPVREAGSMPAWLENPEAPSEPASVRFAKTSVAAVGGSVAAEDELGDPNWRAEVRKPKTPPAAVAEESEIAALPDFLKTPSSSSRKIPEIAHPPAGRTGRTAMLLCGGIAAVVLLSLTGGGWYLWQLPGRAAWMASFTEKKPAAARPAQASEAGAEIAARPPLGTAPAQPVSAESTGPAAAGEARLTMGTNYDPIFSAPRPAKKALDDQGQPGFSLPVAAPSPSASQTDGQNASAASTATVFPSADKQTRLPIPAEADLATRTPARKMPDVSAEEAGSHASAAAGVPGSMAPVTSAALQENLSPTSKPPLPQGGQVRPARLISSVPPAYPLAARALRISGDVVVDAVIEANGNVGAMKLVSGNPQLRQAAMDALRKWRYQPAILNGEAVSTHLQVTIRFRLQN